MAFIKYDITQTLTHLTYSLSQSVNFPLVQKTKTFCVTKDETEEITQDKTRAF